MEPLSMLGVLGLVALCLLPIGAVAAGVFALFHGIQYRVRAARIRREGGTLAQPGPGDGSWLDGIPRPPHVLGHRRRALQGGAVCLGCVLGVLALLIW